MDLKLSGQWFIIGGASSGFGRAVTERLIEEGALVAGIARNKGSLADMEDRYKGSFKGLAADLSAPETIELIKTSFDLNTFSGALINAGGPPAKQFMETTIENWDDSYKLLLRWKVAFTQLLVPYLLKNGYGRLLYIESVSVKQPVDNLVLSNSLRMSVVGFVKTLSREIQGKNITMNVLAPGYHDTPAVQRVFRKKAELTGISIEEARKDMINQIPAGRIGDPADFAALAVWLLSPLSAYINGQTISVEGGLVRASLG